MNRRGFLKFLGIGIPAAVVASTVLPAVAKNTLDAIDPLTAWIKNWKSYPWHETITLNVPKELKTRAVYFDKELVANIKEGTRLTEILSSNEPIKFNTGVRRQFFQYGEKS
jgi:hypothetical protein